MFTLAQLVCCLLVPGFLALALGVLARNRDGIRPAGLGGGVLVFAALVGHLTAALTAGDALWPPRDGWHWAIPACFAVAMLTAFRPLDPVQGWKPPVIPLILHVLVAGLGAWLLLRPVAHLKAWEIAAWSLGFALFSAGSVTVVTFGLRDTRRLGWLALAGAAAGIAAGVVAGGSKDLGLFAGTLAAATTALALAGAPNIGAGAAAIPLGWFILLGLHYASLHPASAAILALAPTALILSRIPAVIRHPRLAGAVRVVAPLAVAGLGIAVGMLLAPQYDSTGY